MLTFNGETFKHSMSHV